MDSFLGAGHGLDDFQVRRYLTYYEDCNLIEGSDRHTGRVSQSGQIGPGQVFDIERVDKGKYRLVIAAPKNQGLVNTLLACPVKGWFAPIESESTDSLGSLS